MPVEQEWTPVIISFIHILYIRLLNGLVFIVDYGHQTIQSSARLLNSSVSDSIVEPFNNLTDR